jgi:HPt (histidine-containing phosphotransfer) domain-containing protein
VALPIEEIRSRIEFYVKSRVPRAYRFDWSDLRCRISYHREVEEELRKAVEELGGRVVRIVEARPPLRIMYVDFSGARAPPAPIPSEIERMILWSKFSAILTAMGVARPEEYAREFEEELAALVGRSFEEKQRAVEELARDIARRVAPPPAAPPPPVVPPELAERLEAIERAVRELREAVAWRPRSAEELRMTIEAAMLVEPAVAVRVDAAGHRYWGPSDECMAVLRSILDRWAVAYFESCPICRSRLPGGALSPRDFVEHLIEKEAAVPPIFIEWLRRLADAIEAAEKWPP